MDMLEKFGKYVFQRMKSLSYPDLSEKQIKALDGNNV